MPKKDIYKILFHNDNAIYEIYAQDVQDSNMIGFLEVNGITFSNQVGLVVDPSEEKLRKEFQGVDVTFIPSYSVIRIDLVEKQGIPKIKEVKSKKSNVAKFPTSTYIPETTE